jgi:hypothetical protein
VANNNILEGEKHMSKLAIILNLITLALLLIPASAQHKSEEGNSKPASTRATMAEAQVAEKKALTLDGARKVIDAVKLEI